MSAGEVWIGRVFTDGVSGGNHTAIVRGVPALRMAQVAAQLDVPDTGFVVGDGSGGLTLRSFSPVEELAQCVQTSLAAAVCADLPAGRTTTIRHGSGHALEVRREDGDRVWAEDPAAAPETPSRAKAVGGRSAVKLGSARPRLFLELASAEELERLVLAPEEALALCRKAGVNGVVAYVPGPDAVQARVFTTSLGGREDRATGGAVLALGRLLARSGRSGELAVVQGAGPAEGRGFLRLRIDGDRVQVGGLVQPLVVGELALP
jgi:predicted PhzF superfamily epimerase YddE/YHI9